MANRTGKNRNSNTLFSWASKSLWMVTSGMKFKGTFSLEENRDQPRQHVQKQRHHFADKCLDSQNHGFPTSHV